MSWVDTIANWGAEWGEKMEQVTFSRFAPAYKTVAPMLELASGLPKIEMTTISYFGKTILYSSYLTVAPMFELAGALPKIGYTAVTQPSARRTYQNFARILGQDIAPTVIATALNDSYQGLLAPYGLNDNGALLNTLLYTAQTVPQLATNLYQIHKGLKVGSRLFVLGLNPPKQPDIMPVPFQDVKLKLPERLKNTFDDTLTYLGTRALIYPSYYIPWVGENANSMLKTIHNGHYILSFATSELTSKHKREYLNQYPELALSLGITHAWLSWYINSYIESVTDAPRYLYRDTIETLLLILVANAAKHLYLPPAVEVSNRINLDPVAWYEAIVSLSLEVVAAGLKIKIPEKFNTETSVIPWDKIAYYAKSAAKSAWQLTDTTPIKQTINMGKLILPYQTVDGFVSDPITEHNWFAVREATLNIVDAIVNANRHNRHIWLPQWAKEGLASGVAWYKGTPLSLDLIGKLLQLLNNQPVINALNAARLEIEHLHPEHKPTIEPTANLPKIAEPVSNIPKISTPNTTEPNTTELNSSTSSDKTATPPAPDPSTYIKRRPIAKTPESGVNLGPYLSQTFFGNPNTKTPSTPAPYPILPNTTPQRSINSSP